MKPKPRSRMKASTSLICSGATSIAALLRKKCVPTTTSSPCAPRRSWAISSRPVASGTRAHPAAAGDADRVAGDRLDGELGLDELLGAAAAVAGAPAQVRLGQDHRAELQDAVHERLGAGRAARGGGPGRHQLSRPPERVVFENA